MAGVMHVGTRRLGRITEVGGLVRLLAHLHVVDLDHLGVSRVALLVRQLHSLGRAALALALLALFAFALAALGLLLAILAFRRLGLGDVGEVEIAQDRAGQPPEGGLVLDGARQQVEVLAGPALDLGAELLDEGLGPVGRRITRQPFADQQREHVGHGRAGAILRAVEALALDLAFQGGGQVGANAAERVGADGVGARLLQRFEDRRALRRLGPQPRMRGIVVVSQAQGHLVGEAPDTGGFFRRQVARRVRQDRLVPLQARPLGREHHLKVRQLGERTRRVGERALERFGGSFRLAGHGCAISGL